MLAVNVADYLVFLAAAPLVRVVVVRSASDERLVVDGLQLPSCFASGSVKASVGC